jgi:hypothetical protein
MGSYALGDRCESGFQAGRRLPGACPLSGQEFPLVRYAGGPGLARTGVQLTGLLDAVTMDCPGFESVAEYSAARA